jgi:hypothetical protein
VVTAVGDERLASELQGNTLRVYWYFIKNPNASSGPRDIQRKLGFSSPSLAVYHLEKLVNFGVVEKTAGAYHLLRVIDVDMLKQFTRIRGFIFPRQVLYASMWTTLLAGYLCAFRTANSYSAFALLFGILGTGIFWYESFKNWQNRPS